jgi:hypothetical protein
MRYRRCAVARGLLCIYRETDDLLVLQLAHQAGKFVPAHRSVGELQPKQAALGAVDDRGLIVVEQRPDVGDALGLGALGLNDAVWNEAFCFVISTAPITPACNSSKSAPRLADQASVRGESFAKNPAIRAEMSNDTDGLRAGSPSIAANSFCMARADGAPRLSLR